MTPASLTAWLTRHDLNKSEAASFLGIARTTLDRYLSGKTAIPHVVRLACNSLDLIAQMDALKQHAKDLRASLDRFEDRE